MKTPEEIATALVAEWYAPGNCEEESREEFISDIVVIIRTERQRHERLLKALREIASPPNPREIAQRALAEYRET